MYLVRVYFFIILMFGMFRSDVLVGQKDKLQTGPFDDNTFIRWATAHDFDGGGLVFCRGYYEQNRSEPEVYGWYVDYPGADHNLLVRLSELTQIRINRDSDHKPLHVVVRLDSPLIFRCPVLFLSDVGTIGLKDAEIDNLRKYFEKGGFLWADDFWGSAGWDHWEQQIRQVLPSGLYPMVDITEDHPIMHQLYDVSKVPQIPKIDFWYSTKQTSERGKDSEDVHFRGIEDEKGRLIVVITHNTDLGDTFEMEGSDKEGEYFYKFSSIGYSIGINIFLYALSH